MKLSSESLIDESTDSKEKSYHLKVYILLLGCLFLNVRYRALLVTLAQFGVVLAELKKLNGNISSAVSKLRQDSADFLFEMTA
jgi:hypothetical protein